MEQLKFTTGTSIKDGLIVTDVDYHDGMGRTQTLLRQTLNTSEMHIREALIQMGWAPPSIGGWIPHDEQENVLGVLWALLREVEERTDPKKDVLAARDVEGAYTLLNKIGYTQATPRWMPANILIPSQLGFSFQRSFLIL